MNLLKLSGLCGVLHGCIEVVMGCMRLHRVERSRGLLELNSLTFVPVFFSRCCLRGFLVIPRRLQPHDPIYCYRAGASRAPTTKCRRPHIPEVRFRGARIPHVSFGPFGFPIRIASFVFSNSHGAAPPHVITAALPLRFRL